MGKHSSLLFTLIELREGRGNRKMADAADPLTLFAEEEERAQQEASEAAQKKLEEERNKQKERSGSFFNPFDPFNGTVVFICK